MVQSEATMPPSTRRMVSEAPVQSFFMADNRSAVWKHTDSRAARASSLGPVLRVRP